MAGKGSAPAGGRRTPRPRLDDVAEQVGVSAATVSLVLRGVPGPSELTRDRVLRAADQLGYRADRTASLLARRRAHLLGVLLDVRNQFHAELIEHLHEAAEKVGYDLVLSTVTGTRSEQRAVETLLDFRCEALILLGPDAPRARLEALERQRPVVLVGRRLSGSGADVVRSADGVGVGQAVDHLISLGHRDIAFLDGGRGAIATDRRRGYRKAMRRHGLDDQIRVVAADQTEEAGARATRSLVESGDLPSAVIAFNDRCALGVLDSLTRAGLDVPAACSVVGYDDSALAQLAHVSLTTVNQDARQQAAVAVAAALERLDHGRSEAREVVLSPRLVVRRTTAAPGPASRAGP